MQSLSDQDHAAASALHSLSSPPADSSLSSVNYLPTSPTSPIDSPASNNKSNSNTRSMSNRRSAVALNGTGGASPSSNSNSSLDPNPNSNSNSNSSSNPLAPPPPPSISKSKKGKEKSKARASIDSSTDRDREDSMNLEIKSEDQSFSTDNDQSNKRKKASRACVHCQKSHLTCEDARPCSRCVKRGFADSCTDGVRKKAKYLLSEEELAELNARKAAEKLEKGGTSTSGRGSISKSRASVSSASSEPSSSRPRQMKKSSSNRSMLAASPQIQSLPNETSTGLGLLQSSPVQIDLELPSNENEFNNNLQPSISTDPTEISNTARNPNPNSRGAFARYDPTPYTFGSEATSLEYSMLSSMLNDIDPSLIGGTGTPDWNQLSPHTHYSENSDEYKLNRYDGVAAPTGLNPASISGTSIAGTGGGQVNAEAQDVQDGSNSNLNSGEKPTVIGSDEALNGFTNWNNGETQNNNEDSNKTNSNSNSNPNNRRSSRNSRNKNNNNYFLPSLTSLSSSNGTSSSSNLNFKTSTASALPTSLLSNSTSINDDPNQTNGENSFSTANNDEDREPTSAALTDSQVRARHASVFDPDPHSMSASAWKERVGKVYSQKIKPFPYTEGYHFLLKYCTENFEKADVLRIVRALAVFRPSLIALQMPLTEEDEIFVERSLQRTVLELEKLISFSGTPTVVWRRTCEICVVGAEFIMLTQWSREHLLGRFIYQFLDKESSINYWETFALHAFDAGRQSVMLKCTLVTPSGKLVPCSACFSIKRDIFDLPSLIVGNFLPILS